MTKAIDKDAIPMRHGRRIRVRRYACDDMRATWQILAKKGRGTMSDGPLLNDVTRAFAEAHRNEDVRDLALKTKRTADLLSLIHISEPTRH
mgnify:CR=1 FL=1